MLTSYFQNGGMIGKTLDFAATDRYQGTTPSGPGLVSFVENATRSGAGQTTDIVTSLSSMPVAVGDLVVVVFSCATTSTGPRAFPIAGYTELANHSHTGAGQDVQVVVGAKFYSGAADDTFTVTGGSGSSLQAWGLLIYIFRGVDPTILDVPVQVSTSLETFLPDPPSITPVTSGAAVLVIGAAGHSSGFLNYGMAGATNILNASGNDTYDLASAAGTVLDWSSGAVDIAPFLAGGTDSIGYNSVGLSLALRPAPGSGGGGGAGTTLTYLNNYADESNPGNPVTFSNVGFGSEAADRHIIVGYSTRNDNRTINSVTIGGVPATILTQLENGNTTTGLAIAAVPTGASGDVVVTLNGSADAHYLGVWSATGLASATPVATATSAGSGSDGGAQSFTMDTDPNGFVIVVDGSAAGGNGPENSATVSANLTLRYDGVATTPLHTSGSSAGADGMTDGTTTTFEITIGDTNNNNPGVAATFAGTEAGVGPAEGNLMNSGIWDITGYLDAFAGGDAAPTYELGLTASLLTVSGPNDAWSQRTVDISSYAGATVRLVFHYQNGDSFIGDIQLDQIDLDGNVYSFENQTHGFETSTGGNDATYSAVTWSNLAVEQDNRGRWQVDQGGTPSNNTARSDAANGSYYVYAETSSPANQAGYNIWLRGPEVVLGSSPTLTFFEARNGAGIGTLNVYLEVIS